MNSSDQLPRALAAAHFEILGKLPSLDNAPLLPSLERNSFSIPVLVLLTLISYYLIWLSFASGPVVKAPVAGSRSIFEPTFLLRLRFVFRAVDIMNDGYKKFQDQCYIVRRMDTDITMIPQKYLNELRTSGRSGLNATHANIYNVMGSYTNLNLMKTNDHFHRVITNHLNPNLSAFMEGAQEELNYGLGVDMPAAENNEWVSVDIHGLLKRTISRIATRLMLGTPHCRNDTTLEITQSHTMAIFGVTLILRRFPPLLHPLVALFIPQRWQIWNNVRRIKNIIGPIRDERLAQKASGEVPRRNGPKTLLEWMIDNGTPEQTSLYSLVSTQLAVTVAAIWTSSQVTSHLLLFLAANPQYIEELRQEVNEHTDDITNINPNKLRKMEACIVETLRLNPPLTNAPQRRAMSDVHLKDGTIIPKGALVAFPCVPASQSASNYDDPLEFRPFRPDNFAAPVTTPTLKKLAFGWGSQACPGRFLAAKEIKLVAARLLMEYDIALAPGAEKMSRTYDIEDLRVLNPRMRLMMRRRVPT